MHKWASAITDGEEPSEEQLTVKMFSHPLQNNFKDERDGYISLSLKQQNDFDTNHTTTTLCHHDEQLITFITRTLNTEPLSLLGL